MMDIAYQINVTRLFKHQSIHFWSKSPIHPTRAFDLQLSHFVVVVHHWANSH